MSDKIIHLNEGAIKQELKELVRHSVEEPLNSLLDQEAAELTNASRYERTEERKGDRSGHYERNGFLFFVRLVLYFPIFGWV